MSVFSEFDSFSRVDGTEGTYELDAPLIWKIGQEQSDWTLIVPAGTRFDISVPWIARWYLSPHDRAILPCAAVHDELLVKEFDLPFSSAEFRRTALARGASKSRGWILFFSTLIWTVATRRSARDVWNRRHRPDQQN